MLYQERQYLKKLMIKNLILDDLNLQWNEAPDKIITQRKILRDLSKNSFTLHLQVGLNEDLPKWDSSDWNAVLENIKTICLAARQSGIRSIIINTDTGGLDRRNYRKISLWDPEFNDRYQDISDSFAEQIIYQRGREVMQTIQSVEPRMQVAIYPVGPAEPITQNYTYWQHFASGMLSIKHNSEIKFIANIRKDPDQELGDAAQMLVSLFNNNRYTADTLTIIPHYQSKALPEEQIILTKLQEKPTGYILQARFSELLQFLAEF